MSNLMIFVEKRNIFLQIKTNGMLIQWSFDVYLKVKVHRFSQIEIIRFDHAILINLYDNFFFFQSLESKPTTDGTSSFKQYYDSMLSFYGKKKEMSRSFSLHLFDYSNTYFFTFYIKIHFKEKFFFNFF